MVAITPTHPKRAKTRSFPRGYVEDFSEPRTELGPFSASCLKFDGGGSRHRLLIRHREIRFHVHVQQKLCCEAGGEKSDQFIKLGDFVDIPLACHDDSIFRTFELAL